MAQYDFILFNNLETVARTGLLFYYGYQGNLTRISDVRIFRFKLAASGLTPVNMNVTTVQQQLQQQQQVVQQQQQQQVVQQQQQATTQQLQKVLLSGNQK